MSASLLRCPVCAEPFARGAYAVLAAHFVALADRSEPAHVMWLNRRVTKRRTDATGLARLLRAVLEGEPLPPETERVGR